MPTTPLARPSDLVKGLCSGGKVLIQSRNQTQNSPPTPIVILVVFGALAPTRNAKRARAPAQSGALTNAGDLRPCIICGAKVRHEAPRWADAALPQPRKAGRRRTGGGDTRSPAVATRAQGKGGGGASTTVRWTRAERRLGAKKVSNNLQAP